MSGLKNLGLGKLEDAKLYEEEVQEKPIKEKAALTVVKDTAVKEKDLIYDKSFTCPVCDHKFTSKIMKTGKARLLSMDLDLKPRYEGIDSVKYDIQVCPQCKYAAMTNYFNGMLSAQARMIRENISNQVQITFREEEIYSYDTVLERYQLALACAIVKHAKDSEKAYLCLKYAWAIRGYAESLGQDNAELKEQELECINNALEGFINARQKESLPICGMDQYTLDYLIGALAYEVKRYDVAAKMVSGILVAPAVSARIKDKARDLTQLILDAHKKG